MHERFVIAVLVSRTELQVAVQKQLKPGASARDYDALIMRVFRVDDLIGKHLVFGKRRDLVCLYQTNQQQNQHDECFNAQRGNAAFDQRPQQPRAPQRD